MDDLTPTPPDWPTGYTIHRDQQERDRAYRLARDEQMRAWARLLCTTALAAAALIGGGGSTAVELVLRLFGI